MISLPRPNRQQFRIAAVSVALVAIVGGAGYFAWRRRSNAFLVQLPPGVHASGAITLLDYAGQPLPIGHVYVTGNRTTYEGNVAFGGTVVLAVPTSDMPASTGYFISYDGRQFRTDAHLDATGASTAWGGWYFTGTSTHVPSGPLAISLTPGVLPVTPTFSQLSVMVKANSNEDIQNLLLYYRKGNAGAYKVAYGVYDGAGTTAGTFRYHFDLDRTVLVAGTSLSVRASASNSSGSVVSTFTLPVGKAL